MADPSEPITVLLVDPADELGPLSRALAATDETLTVETVPSAEDTPRAGVDPDCIVVLEYAAENVDGVEQFHAVREHVEDVPIVIFAIDPEAYYAPNVLSVGAADVICTAEGPAIDEDHHVVTVRRLRHAAGKGQSFQTPGELLDSVMEHLPHQVFIKDDVGRIAAISTASVRKHKPSRDQLIGMTDYELFEMDTARKLRKEEQAIMATEEPMINRVEHFVDDVGRDRWVNTTKAPRYDSDGEVAGIIGTARNITEQKRHEEMMTALHVASRELVSAKRVQSIADTAVDISERIPDLPVLEVFLADDATGDLSRVATGRTTDRPSVRDRYNEWVDRAYETGTVQFIVQLTDGDPPAVVGYAEPDLPDSVEPIAVVLPLGDHGVLEFESTSDPLDEFSVDLMEVLAANVEAALDRVAREDSIRDRERELERQNERLEEFASIVSHDLRNPLSVAQGYAETFDEDDESGQEVRWALDRMERLTDELLTLARRGQIVGKTHSVSLRKLAERAWQSVETGELTLDVREDRTFEADPDRTVELLENLFHNSVEHGTADESNGALTTVTVGATADGFYVEDDGTGIDAADEERIFEQGYSGGDGTGFGLYIVDTLADAHGWSVSVVDAAHAECGVRFEFLGVE